MACRVSLSTSHARTRRFTVQTDRQAECFYPTLLHHEHTSQASRNGGTPSHPQRHASVSSAVGSGTGNVVSRVTDAAHGVVDAVRQPLLQAFEEADEDDDGSEGVRAFTRSPVRHMHLQP